MQKEIDDLKEKIKGLFLEIEAKNDYIKELRETKSKRFNDEECWMYQGDEHDNLDSLVCPVVISAKELSNILKDKEKAEKEAFEYSWVKNPDRMGK